MAGVLDIGVASLRAGARSARDWSPDRAFVCLLSQTRHAVACVVARNRPSVVLPVFHWERTASRDTDPVRRGDLPSVGVVEDVYELLWLRVLWETWLYHDERVYRL